jgi:hypothetical protein
MSITQGPDPAAYKAVVCVYERVPVFNTTAVWGEC